MKFLFVGESWSGSCARSLSEALGRQIGHDLIFAAEDLIVPKPRRLSLRIAQRLLAHEYRRDVLGQLTTLMDSEKPDVLMVYKGFHVGREVVQAAKARGILAVNVFPDHTPLVYGARLVEALRAYDLIISTKPHHPQIWNTVYGFQNRCLFVPQGYDPVIHLVDSDVVDPEFDIVLVATHRAEYERIMVRMAEAPSLYTVSIGIYGNGWAGHALPGNIVLRRAVSGKAYVKAVRNGRVAIAPVTTEVVHRGKRLPGDVDSTRTYELAAARTCFIHRRTEFAEKLFEGTGIQFFDGADDLAATAYRLLSCNDERIEIARRAQMRAVPAFSLDERAAEICSICEQMS